MAVLKLLELARQETHYYHYTRIPTVKLTILKLVCDKCRLADLQYCRLIGPADFVTFS